MKKKPQRSRGNSQSPLFGKKQLPLRFYGALEPLEARQVLTGNVLASAADMIESPTDTDEVLMVITMPDSPGATATLMFELNATDESGLDALAPTVFDANGNEVAATSFHDANGSTDGLTVADLGAGEYTITVGSQGGSTGEYALRAVLLGDVEAADTMVGEFETLRASAAMVQFLGTGNFVTDLFYQTRGIDLGVDQYDPAMDANADGGVGPVDFAKIESNADIGRVQVEFIPDVDPPVISDLGLVTDTGNSNTDRITSNAAVSGNVVDEREITQFFVSLDDSPLVDVTNSVAIAADGDFVVPQTLLDTLAGGTLADGPHTLNLSAVDDLGNMIDPADEFDFVLIRNNTAPTSAGIPSDNATEDVAYSYDVSGFFTTDPGDVLTFSAAALPSWLSFSSSGVFSGTPGNADVGSFMVDVTATDFAGLTGSAIVSITVDNTNDAPNVVAISDQVLEEDVLFSLDIGAFVSDPDVGDTITTSVVQSDGDNGLIPLNQRELPGWLSFDAGTGILSGTPTIADLGQFTVSVFVVDTVGESDVTSFDITVQNVNDAPELTGEIPDQTTDEEVAFSLNLSSFFNDTDPGDVLTYTATADGGALPAWLSLNAATGVLSGTADDADIGSVTIVATATDTFDEFAADTFLLTVNGVDEAPVVVDQVFRVDPTDSNGTVVGTVDASDDDPGDTLTFAITGGSGATAFAISAAGQLTITDANSLVDGETLNLIVEVTDSTMLSDTAVMTMNVTSNLAPVAVDDTGFATDDVLPLSIAPSALVGNDTDPDGDTLSVSAVAVTSSEGASVTIDQDTGLVIYDPTASSKLLMLNAGEPLVDTFEYTVSDGNGGTDTGLVSVTVNGTGPDVQFILRTFDTAGNEVVSIDPGDTFELRAFVQDIGAGEGVFAAFLDVTYNAGLATPSGSIVHSVTYSAGPSGSTGAPGLIDEVGGTDGITPLGDAEFEVFRLEFTAANNDGLLVFSSDPAEDTIQHPVLVFGGNDNVFNEQILFGTTSLAIGAVAPLSGGGGTISNPLNPFDVNGDTQVSPLDALLVINHINGTHDGDGIFYDVNDDGLGSPIDALLVINEMASATPSSSLTTGTINGDDGSSLAVDDLFAALGDDSIELGQPWDDIVDFLQDSSPTLIAEITDHLEGLEDGEEIDDFNDWLMGLEGLL
jgi:VCBS repeat-containing protein